MRNPFVIPFNSWRVRPPEGVHVNPDGSIVIHISVSGGRTWSTCIGAGQLEDLSHYGIPREQILEDIVSRLRTDIQREHGSC